MKLSISISSAWKPSMTRTQAQAWSRGSVMPNAFYHGLGISERGERLSEKELKESVKSILAKGFHVGTGSRDGEEVVNGAMLGNGVYMSEEKRVAERYGQVLELRINVVNPFIHEGRGPNQKCWPRQYAQICRQNKKLGLGLGTTERIGWWAKQNKIDALSYLNHTVVFDPKNVVVIKEA